MNPYLLTLLIGLCFIVVFGGLSYVRREGLSGQFAAEVLAITAVVEVLMLLTGMPVNPVIFLIVIYLISMRGRLLVDLGNMLSGRGRQKDAITIMQLALRLFPDNATRLVTLVNMGIVQLRRKNPASAQQLFETVLQEAESGYLGLKYESACRYNYGVALMQQGREAEAVGQFNQAISLLPNSIYSKAAMDALEQRKKRKPAESDSGVEES
jgi:tetratricopeptide (TPR) repeat protein